MGVSLSLSRNKEGVGARLRRWGELAGQGLNACDDRNLFLRQAQQLVIGGAAL